MKPINECIAGMSWPGLAHILTDYIKSELDASLHSKKALDPGLQSLMKDFVRLADDGKRSGLPPTKLHSIRLQERYSLDT